MAIRLKPWLGRPVENPGIYAEIPITIYHSANCCIGPSISSTGLRTIFRQSPAHYWAHSVYNPHRVEKEETAFQILGTATHHLLLGEERFRERFAIRPDRIGGVRWSGQGPACEAWRSLPPMHRHENELLHAGLRRIETAALHCRADTQG